MLQDLEKSLRDMADQVRDAYKNLVMPKQSYSIQQAFRTLRAALGDTRYISISPPSFDWHGKDDPIKCDLWSVYDGNTHYRGATLGDAVNQAIAAAATNQEPPEVEAVLDEAMQPMAF